MGGYAFGLERQAALARVTGDSLGSTSRHHCVAQRGRCRSGRRRERSRNGARCVSRETLYPWHDRGGPPFRVLQNLFAKILNVRARNLVVQGVKTGDPKKILTRLSHSNSEPT